MKTKINYLLVFLGCMLIFPLTSNAQCSYERQAELSRIAANVQFSYTYEIENNVPIFTVNMVNATNDIYIEDYTTNRVVRETEYDFVYSFDGRTIKYNIYSNDGECINELILTKYINLPPYNKFSNLEDCKRYPNFKYCQTWLDTELLNSEDFEKEITEFTDKKMHTNKSQPAKGFVAFIEQYKMLLFIIAIFTVTWLLFICVKRRVQ